MIDLRSQENILETSETEQEPLFLAYHMPLTPTSKNFHHGAPCPTTVPGDVDADHFNHASNILRLENLEKHLRNGGYYC